MFQKEPCVPGKPSAEKARVQIPPGAPQMLPAQIFEYLLSRRNLGFRHQTLRTDSVILRFLAKKTDLTENMGSRNFIRRRIRVVNGKRFYEKVTVDPENIWKVYVSTIPSFNSIETEEALIDFIDTMIFLKHPMPDINSELTKERYYTSETSPCVEHSIVRLYDSLKQTILHHPKLP